MTVIAYRDGVMAADSEVQEDGIRVGRVRKIIRTRRGQLIGCCGGVESIAAFHAWARGGFKAKDSPGPFADDSFAALVVQPDESVTVYEAALRPYPVEAPFHTAGSGSAVALGAMAAGATAERAAKIATDLCHGCSGPIDILTLRGKAK